MASQLGHTVDLHSDVKQAVNVCCESQIPKRLQFQNMTNGATQTKDAETQTISSTETCFKIFF